MMVFGVVLQQPPIRDAPDSFHLHTYGTKLSSETPVAGYKSKKKKKKKNVQEFIVSGLSCMNQSERRKNHLPPILSCQDHKSHHCWDI